MNFVHAWQALPVRIALPLIFGLLSAASFAIVAFFERRQRNRFVSYARLHRNHVGISVRVSRAFIKHWNGVNR